jgi:hypothetical protein
VSSPVWLFSLYSLVLVATVVGLFACADRELRGTTSPSADGETYLSIVDDGAICEGLEVDGDPWTHGLDRAARISPGTHEIGCSGEALLSFEIEEGVVFEFDYWGP